MNIEFKNCLKQYIHQNLDKSYDEFTVCATGHRSDQLPGGYRGWNHLEQYLIRKMYLDVFLVLMEELNCPIRIIGGGALGIDQLEMAAALAFQKMFPKMPITTEIAIPYFEQPNIWRNKEDTLRYTTQKLHCNTTTFVDTISKYAIKGIEEGKYHVAKLQKRNEYMVDESHLILAYWNGNTYKSGTYNCICYINKMQKPYLNLYDLYYKYYLHEQKGSRRYEKRL